MIAFFFTMPISSTMPMSAITLNSCPLMMSAHERADAGRWQCGQDRERMDVALVEDAQDEIDSDEGRGNQDRLVRERGLERLGRALERRLHAGRHAECLLRLVHRRDGLAERST